jgi:hypothetical protein
MYDDAGSGWGHRHAILWYPYNDNSGPSGQEGFLGIGRANGGPYQGPFSQPWNFAELIVMNVFDPCATWQYAATYTISGSVLDSQSGPVEGVLITASGGFTVSTNSSGVFTLSELASGTYTLTPSKSGYTFSPVSLTASVPPDASGQNFTATALGPTTRFYLPVILR